LTDFRELQKVKAMKHFFSYLFLLVFSVLFIANHSSAKESEDDRAQALGMESCHSPSNAEKKLFPVDWKSYENVFQICSLKRHGKTVLHILNIDYQSLYSQQKGAVASALETKPLMIDTKGKKIGSLPESLLINGPAYLELVFWSWENGFPRRIIPLRHNSAVSGDSTLPELYWDQSSGMYKQSSGQ
jgi:hypothetical protein